jgi:N-dimethylarginine dimethylaminohydrolase
VWVCSGGPRSIDRQTAYFAAAIAVAVVVAAEEEAAVTVAAHAPEELEQITRQPFPAFLMNLPLFISTQDPNNVWMRELDASARQVDRAKATRQFLELYHFLAARSAVYLLPSRVGLQDQVYVANLGIVLEHTPEPTVVVSSFRSEPRREEQAAGLDFFRALSLPTVVAPDYFEGEADLKHLRENVYVGAHGVRTSRAALHWFEERFGMEVIPFFVDNEYLYHLDCSVFPIAPGETLVCADVATEATIKAIEKQTRLIDVSVEDAESGITNCVRVGGSVLCASNIEEISATHEDYPYERHKRESLERICSELGLEPVYFNLSEFLKSGAMLSCMVMHLNGRNF